MTGKTLVLFKEIFDQSLFLIVCQFTTYPVIESANPKSMESNSDEFSASKW